MNYTARNGRLKNLINHTAEQIQLSSNLCVRNFHFTSRNFHILPGDASYDCTTHHFHSNQCYLFGTSPGIMNEVLDVHDSQVTENSCFHYHLFMPGRQQKAQELVILLHGFNEKSWIKYYPWAERIAEQTGKAVLLFPMAFHMNRAPHAWSETRAMFAASEQRKSTFPLLLHSSLTNVAISTRLHAKPQRFVWSGLQTYYDIIQLTEQIRAGNHPAVEATAGIDFFGYSIGAFLSEILLMTNHKNYFSHSKLVLFCGGPVFNRISPVSKFILDSEANVTLYSFLVEHLESYLASDERLKHYLSDKHEEGMCFRSMLSYSTLEDFREERLKKIADRLYAVALNGDTVMYPHEVMNTLQGKYRNIPVAVDAVDLPYHFIHEAPFPAAIKNEALVDKAFDTVFNLICKQLQ